MNFKSTLPRASLLSLWLASTSAWANSYTFVDLGDYVDPVGIDSQEVIAATRNVLDLRGIERAAYFKNGEWRFEHESHQDSTAIAMSRAHEFVLGTIRGAPVIWQAHGKPVSFSSGWPTGINSDGDVSQSTSKGPGSQCQVWSWHTGTAQDLGFLGNGDTCFADGIDDRGHVFGAANLKVSGALYAFEWHHGRMHKLQMLDHWTSAEAVAGNTAGLVVGWASVGSGANVQYAVLWQDRVAHQLQNGPHLHNQAFAINDAGTIVGGSWDDNDFGSAAVRWDTSGQSYDLATETDFPSDWHDFVRATGVSPDGVIVGYGHRRNGNVHGFMLIPQ